MIQLFFTGVLLSSLPQDFRTTRNTCLLAALVFGARPVVAGEETSRGKQVFYVATNGNDAWSGTLREPNRTRTDGPFASLVHARDAIRKLKIGGSPTVPVIVHVRGGTYTLTGPIVFNPEDSGTPRAPVTYRAYCNEMPILSGG